MILAYRYIRDKRRKAKTTREAQENGLVQPQSQTPSGDDATINDQALPQLAPVPPSSGRISSTAKWKLMLMAALVVPVFFETLDYTG